MNDQLFLRKNCLLLAATVLTLLFQSCVVYHPHNVDIPLLSEPGEKHLEVSASETFPSLVCPALNASFAYAPVQMLGLQFAGSVSDFKNCHLQAATGTWQTFGYSVLECYIGYAYGRSFNDTTGLFHRRYYVEGYYTMLFSQINFGWRGLMDDLLDIGFGVKGGLLMPKLEKEEVLSDGSITLDERHDQSHFVLEPQLMFRFGLDKVKYSINVAYAAISDWPVDDNFFNYDRFSVSMGVNFRF